MHHTNDLGKHIRGKWEQVQWIREYERAILRGLIYEVGQHNKGKSQASRRRQCLGSLIRGHYSSVETWLWRATGITRADSHKEFTTMEPTKVYQIQNYQNEWGQEIRRGQGVIDYLSQHERSIIHSLRKQLHDCRKHIKRLRRDEKRRVTMEEEKCYMDRRLAEWERRIPAQYRVAVDDIVAEYMGIGTVEGRGWQWTNAETACTDMIRQLHGGQRAHQEEGHTRNPTTHHRSQSDGDISQHRPMIMVCHTSTTA